MTLPHNAQEHNTNQTFLQHIGNTAYHKDKTATNYDSVNSLTTPNNQYTLLYPDLVQELFDFTLHNSNIVKNNVLSCGGLGVNNTKSSSLDSSLSPRDILFFLQIVSLYQLELSKGNTYITYPSLKLAKLLGVDVSCDTDGLSGNANMRATILKMTSRLESLGLLKVFRRKRKNGMDMTNKLVPVLPDRLHTRLKDLPSNLKVSDSSKLEHESNLEHILRTKLFVPIELEFMKSLFKNNLPSKYKLFFLNCVMSAYRNFRQNSSNIAEGNTVDIPTMLSFSSTSPELMQKNNISRSTLDRIFKFVKQQGDNFFLQVEHKYTKSDDIDCNRYDKSIFIISINPLVFPISHISEKNQSQTEGITNFDCDELQNDVLPIFPDTYRGFKTAWSKKQPSIVTKTALNNKEEIIKNKYSRNIDYIDEKSEKEFLENEQSSFPSKSYNNSSFLDVSSSRKSSDISEQKEEWRELRHFYPLSEKDISMLNSRANREFSNNFVNQLLLKLYIKYPEKRFKNRFTFLSYMMQILANEKHQGPLVNHTSFRFSCNVGTEEKIMLEYERYLNQIEDSLDTSKEMQLKKKIAGRFSTEIAYKILTKVEFRTNHDDSFITALIPTTKHSTNQNWLNSDFELSERQIATLSEQQTASLSKRQIAYLSEQLEAVYGINGYYVQEVEEEERIEDVKTEIVEDTESVRRKGERKEEKPTILEKRYSKIKKTDISTNSKDIGNLDLSKDLDTKDLDTNKEEILTNTVWHQIRKGLREELGNAIDTAWFSKAVAVECTETNLLTLTMPTRFMADWVRNNYSYVIRRLSERCGIERVEYRYE